MNSIPPRKIPFIYSYRKILSFYSHKFSYSMCIIFNIIGGIIPYIIMMNLSEIFNIYINHKNFLSDISKKIRNMGILASLMILSLGSSDFLRSYTDSIFVREIRNSIFERTMSQDVSFFDSIPTGALMCSLSEDVASVIEQFSHQFMTFVQNISQVIGGIIIGFIINWRVSLTGLPVLPISLFIIICFSRKIQIEIFKTQSSSAKVLCKAGETLSNFKTVKSFNNEIEEIQEHSKGLDDISKNGKNVPKLIAFKNGLIMFFTFVMAVPIFYYGSYLILKKRRSDITPADVVLLFTIFGMLGMPIQLTLLSIENIQKASVSANKILQILETKPIINQKLGENLESSTGKIEFEHVSFKYPTRNEYSLKDISFTINPGETIAFVGESGSGKTTIIQLMLRLYEINQGKILLDGKDIKNFSPESLRKMFAVVSQEPKLFTMSIYDNIRFGKSDLNFNNEKVNDAAILGNAHNFIMEFPYKYNTIINSNGLSGGQKQRICIARAIYANTPILIFDEATSSLDAESEQLVLQSIDNIKKGKTCIIIGHRLSSISNADKILVLQNGSIVETGNHQELIDKKGIYFDLYNYQQI